MMISKTPPAPEWYTPPSGPPQKLCPGARFRLRAGAFIAIGAALVAMTSFARGLLELPNPPGRAVSDWAAVISGDGSKIGGAVSLLPYKPAIWRASGECLVLGDGHTGGRVVGLSQDGNVAAGYSTDEFGNTTHIFRWVDDGSESGQFFDLGAPPNVQGPSVTAISRLGNAIVGTGRLADAPCCFDAAWVWRQDTGYTVIPAPYPYTLEVTSLSDDGSVVVGLGRVPWDNSFQRQAWRWSVSGGFEPPRLLASPYPPLVSADGRRTFVTCQSVVNGITIQQVVLWLDGYPVENGAVIFPLPKPEGKMSFYATAVSNNGGAVVGVATDAWGANPVPFRWSNGMEILGFTGTPSWFSPSGALYGRTSTGVWRWTGGSGYETINPPSGYFDSSALWLVSQDGDVFLRRDTSGNLWRWSRATGASTMLNTVPANSMNQVSFLSGDASAAIGYSVVNNSYIPWRWKPSTGYLPWSLPGYILPRGQWEEGRAFFGVDVQIVPGPDNQYQFAPWRWTEESGLQNEPPVAIPNPSPFNYSGAFLSADGLSVIVKTDSEMGEEIPASLWTRKNGFRSLSPISYIASDAAISRDASVIVGMGGGTNWLWRASVGFTQLVTPAGQQLNGYGWRLSSDGRVAVTAAWNPATRQSSLLRWTSTTGVQLIPLATEPWTYQTLYLADISADGTVVTGTGVFDSNATSYDAQRAWRWSQADGFQIIGLSSSFNGVSAVSPDGRVVIGYTIPKKELWRWTPNAGTRLLKDDFPSSPWIDAFGTGAGGGYGSRPTEPVLSTDGNVIIGYSTSPTYARQSWIAAYAPAVEKLSPQSAVAGSGDTSAVIYGIGFEPGTKVTFGNAELTPDTITATDIRFTIPATLITTALDFETYEVRVVCPRGDISKPTGFTVIGSQLGTVVNELKTVVVTSGTTSSVEIPPATPSSGGVSAALTVNSADTAASVTVATYSSDPSGSGNTSFDVAGSYVDLNASGVTAQDSLQAFFYFPSGTPAERLVLQFWNTRLLPPAWDTVSPVSVQPEVSRVDVVFNADSHPSITELDGTFFAPIVLPPIQFSGFLAPIGGADGTGGSVTSPLRTFKLGSTIPVKFTATQGGAALTTGLHTLKVQLGSTSITTATAIDATPQGTATTGNQFRYADGQWLLNLDTKATGMTKGIWKLTATLSDKSQHSVWIQLK